MDMYLARVKHQQEMEDIVTNICKGNTSIFLDDDFSSEDLRWIEKEVERKTGLKCSLAQG
jgi:hypothetical protein